MDFFQPRISDEKLHHNFKYARTPYRKAEREMFEAWANGMPDRDGKLCEQFQETFNSTFWEVYLHALLRSYGCSLSWEHSSPDFEACQREVRVIIDATTANAAVGKPNEWDRTYSEEEIKSLGELWPLNREAIIRLSNALHGKITKFNTHYSTKHHVKGKPFVVAVAPFEQPHFNLQHDRPIRALLYDHYVDEDAFTKSPDNFPSGPPVRKLGFVEKDNGSEIRLGLFTDNAASCVSAVLFSCVATWGKLTAMSKNPLVDGSIKSLWSTPPTGKPVWRDAPLQEHHEELWDGVHVYHNPFATNPLPPGFFRRKGVVQHYFDQGLDEWAYEGIYEALLFRRVLVKAREQEREG